MFPGDTELGLPDGLIASRTITHSNQTMKRQKAMNSAGASARVCAHAFTAIR